MNYVFAAIFWLLTVNTVGIMLVTLIEAAQGKQNTSDMKSVMLGFIAAAAFGALWQFS